jgi:hypothetical protein
MPLSGGIFISPPPASRHRIAQTQKFNNDKKYLDERGAEYVMV